MQPKRILKYVAALSVAALALTACGGGGDDADSGTAEGDMIINAHGTEPQNPLIPTNTNEVGGGHIVDAIFAGLVSYATDGSTELEVAESIESEDNLTWTIKLNDGWTFSDGTPVTANSFVDAWNYGANPDNAQLNAYFFNAIEGTDDEGNSTDGETLSGLEVIDDLTFEVTLKEAAADFPDRLGYSAYFPLPEVAFEDMEAFGEKPVSNGPYVLDEWNHDVEAVLSTNPDYEGNRTPENDGLTFKFYTDPDAAYTDVQSGVLDIMDQVPPSAVSTFQDDESIQAFTEPGSVNGTITIPSSMEHFGEDEEGQLRRQAISMAIDREAITSTIFDDTYTPSTDFSSPLMPDFTENIEGAEVLEFNAEEAKDLWAQADEISEFTGSFQLSYNADGAGNREWVEAVTNQIRENLEIEAEPNPFAAFAEFRELITNRELDTAFRTGWQPDYPSVYNYLGPIFGTGAGANDGDYSNPDFDQLLRQAAAAEDEATRAEHLAAAQAILMEDLPAIPLWNRDAIAIAAQGIEGVQVNWQNQPDYHLVTK
ncbi:MAG TPA: ABC transporter substrate-binding protein [Enteractinococcus helveticum]|uniref:ABC transporter substrate-binding protein n=1 Tax=Enteractinococcus helveticum TaxID=1837282 RepID=A0A921FN86_9MICC|nr:ABC transporter substrate-binding protein [Enteractinococcus helveticum]HJF14397.1 ABC transporter substrate-binding protein [Enteractinococcus helveticum]